MNEKIKSELKTERTMLRLIELTDLNSIHNLHSLPETDEFNALGIPESISVTEQIITPWIAENNLKHIKNYTFAITSKEDEQFIGLFGFKIGNEKYKRGEVWFKLHVDHWRKGYGTECLKAILNYGFNTLNLNKLWAEIYEIDIKKLNFFKMKGFEIDATLREHYFHNGNYYSSHILSLLRREYE